MTEGSEHQPPDAPLPPPPPPPDLAPPPGYTEYSQNLSSSVDLRRLGGLKTAIVVLLAVFAVGLLIQAIGTPRIVDSSKDFLAGNLSDDDFDSDLRSYSFMTALGGAAQLALYILSIIWLFRMVKNHRAIGRQTTWGPGMAIGGWFLPPFLYIIPTLILRESWKAADPDVRPGDDRWKSSPDNPLLWVWFVVYSLGTLVLFVLGANQQFQSFGGERSDLAESFADGQGVMLATCVLGIVSAGLWALVVRQWTDRHARLTGEARGCSVFVVRHAKAGTRRAWDGDDTERPLTKGGRRQAEAIAERLAGAPVTGLWSSPYVRCMETLEPLGAAFGMKVVAEPRLAEGASSEQSLELLREAGDGAVFCSHGDVIPDLLDALVRRGTKVLTAPDWRKAAIWVLDPPDADGHVATAAAEPPPE